MQPRHGRASSKEPYGEAPVGDGRDPRKSEVSPTPQDYDRYIFLIEVVAARKRGAEGTFYRPLLEVLNVGCGGVDGGGGGEGFWGVGIRYSRASALMGTFQLGFVVCGCVCRPTTFFVRHESFSVDQSFKNIEKRKKRETNSEQGAFVELSS